MTAFSSPIRPSLTRMLAAMMLAAPILGGCASKPVIDQAGAPPDEVALLAVDLHRDHGWAAIRGERYDEAASFFKRVLRDQEDDADAMLGLGEAYLGLNRLDDALGRFEQIGDRAPAAIYARALQGQGIIWLRRGRHERAEARLNEALEQDAGLWRAWNGLGRVRDAKQDYAAARYAYRKAIEQNGKAALLHNNLGFSLLASGDPVFAEYSLRQALELDPEMEVAASNLRLALALQGRYEPALAGASAAEQAAIMNNVGYAALLRGDHAKARSLFLGAIELDPGFFKEAKRNLAYLETLEADREGYE